MSNSDPVPPGLFDAASLKRACRESPDKLGLYRRACKEAQTWLDSAFRSGEDIERLIHLRSGFIDQLLETIWEQFDWHGAQLSLVAVGGYGRGELHPHSDIDLLILTGRDCDQCKHSIEAFIALLWDIKLNIGHSVRNLEQCIETARNDITVVTTLAESRLITGSSSLLKAMQTSIQPDKMWPSDSFYRAKLEEQRERHSKYADTEYNLEPNVKSSPGGLRDIQTIAWIALRQYGENNPEGLAELGFLTADELDILINGRNFLWRVRYALHMLNGREEDRLLFDHQRELAVLFGYEDSDMRLAVEQFMQRYYRWVLALGQLNEVLMQHFDQVILRADGPEDITTLNSRFQIRNGYIEARNDSVFDTTPSALLEIFVLCAQHAEIEGVHAATIRQIRDHRELIDDAFRREPRNRRLFMELMKSPNKLSLQLRRMNRYGILGKYIPEFGKIVGQMQHDLFHIYTVDAHTLEVVKNMRRFLVPEFQDRFPVTSRVVSRLPKIELLYIAGLFHDIGKGRGGDHSELGAVDAELFCRNHGLSTVDSNLVSWLVKHHLYMSGVAQRKDISDPDVIQEFASVVGDQLHLDYLLALTVADINATNPTLWNAWRGSLLRQLYTEAKRALRRGLENTIDKQEWIRQTQEKALEQLEDRGFIVEEVEDLWKESGEDYFLREQVEDIVWQTEAIAQHFDKETPLVLVKPRTESQVELATQIFIHARAQGYLFSVVAAALEQLDLSVHDARVYSSVDGMALDTFYVLDANGESIAEDPARVRYISDYLSEQLKDRDRYPEIVQRRTPRQIKFFAMPTETTMHIDHVRNVNVLEVTTPDRPGLLARIGRIFFEYGIELQAAKIATLGERVEDVFFITANGHKPIEDEALIAEIQSAICTELDDQAAA
jgi:[protein-PII] uridylyltransferase